MSPDNYETALQSYNPRAYLEDAILTLRAGRQYGLVPNIQYINAITPEERAYIKELYIKALQIESLKRTVANIEETLRKIDTIEFPNRFSPASKIDYYDRGARLYDYLKYSVEVRHNDIQHICRNLGLSDEEALAVAKQGITDLADTLVAHVKNKGQSLLGRCVTLLSAFSEDIDLEMSTQHYEEVAYLVARWAEDLFSLFHPETGNFSRYIFDDQSVMDVISKLEGSSLGDMIIELQNRPNYKDDIRGLSDKRQPVNYYKADILTHATGNDLLADMLQTLYIGGDNQNIINLECGRIWRGVRNQYMGQRRLDVILFFSQSDVATFGQYAPIFRNGTWSDEQEVGIDLGIPVELAIHVASLQEIIEYERNAINRSGQFGLTYIDQVVRPLLQTK